MLGTVLNCSISLAFLTRDYLLLRSALSLFNAVVPKFMLNCLVCCCIKVNVFWSTGSSSLRHSIGELFACLWGKPKVTWEFVDFLNLTSINI